MALGYLYLFSELNFYLTVNSIYCFSTTPTKVGIYNILIVKDFRKASKINKYGKNNEVLLIYTFYRTQVR